MELDHVFIFSAPGDPELDHLASIGLIESARRRHPGQGTENVCFYFDNMFLECLWVHDVAEVRSETIARTKLYERSRWRTDGTNPFGLSWRNGDGAPASTMKVRDYRPPYIPSGGAIDVAVDSDDPRQPMMFRSPGTTPPAQWPADRRGALQRPAGLGRVLKVVLSMPADVAPSAALEALAAATILEVAAGEGFSMSFEIERLRSGTPLVITLPVSGAKDRRPLPNNA